MSRWLQLPLAAVDSLVADAREMAHGSQGVAGSSLIAAIVLLVGWVLALVSAALMRRLLRAARLQEALRSLVGAGEGERFDPAQLVAWAVQWLIMGSAILLALGVFGVEVGAEVGTRLVDVLPRILTSAFLFLAGALTAMLLGGLTRRLFETAGVAGAAWRGRLVAIALTVFAALLAVEQLGFAAQFVMTLGLIAAASVGLAAALAFGLGCRDLARDFVVEYLRSFDETPPKPPRT